MSAIRPIQGQDHGGPEVAKMADFEVLSSLPVCM